MIMSEQKKHDDREHAGCVEQRPSLVVEQDGAFRMSDDEKEYPMNGPCC
jgi:hypothetical protein